MYDLLSRKKAVCMVIIISCEGFNVSVELKMEKVGFHYNAQKIPPQAHFLGGKPPRDITMKGHIFYHKAQKLQCIYIKLPLFKVMSSCRLVFDYREEGS